MMEFPSLIGREVYCDFETTGLQWYRHKIFGVAVGVGDKDYYWDARRHPEVFKWLRAELPRAKRWINHNVKFDVHFVREEGIEVPDDILVCTMVDAALINEHEFSYDLDTLGNKYCGQGKIDINAQIREHFELKKNIGREAVMARLKDMPEEKAGTYAKMDINTTRLLHQRNQQEIELQNLQRIVDLERRLLPVLVRMEWRGVKVDLDAAVRADDQLTQKINELQKWLDRETGIKGFNINSAPQVRSVFRPVKTDAGWVVEVPGRAIHIAATEGGAPSLGADALRAIPGELPAAILNLRRLLRIRDTFVRKHVLAWHQDGVVHCNYNQTKGDNEAGTGTGRLSVNDPALQQIPKRNKELAAIARALFIPYEGQVWGSADWDQFEFRWFAHYTDNPVINKIYADNPDADFHQTVADLTGLPRNATPEVKGNAKQINLGLVFGMGPGRQAMEMGLPYEERPKRNGGTYLLPGPEAEAIFEQYHQAVPGIREILDKTANIATSRGYVMTAMGRHIRFPGGRATHKAGGLVFQGTSADCMKVKMIELDKEFNGTDTYLLLSVHDETDFSMEKDPKIAGRIKEILETFDGKTTPIKCRIPIRASMTMAENWWEASK